MQKLVVAKELLRIGERAKGYTALKVAMLISNELYRIYNQSSDDRIGVTVYRDKIFRPYAWPSVQKAYDFLEANLFGRMYRLKQGNRRYLLRNDKFFRYQTTKVPLCLIVHTLPIRTLYIYIRMFLFLEHSKADELNFNLGLHANVTDIRFLQRFYPLAKRNLADDEDYVTRFRKSPMFAQRFKMHLDILESYGVIRIERANPRQLTIKLIF